MKFIHTADIHWGMIPDSDKPWGKKTGTGDPTDIPGNH